MKAVNIIKQKESRNGMERCGWCLCNEKMTRYHDEEWGVPLHDDRKQFEFLSFPVSYRKIEF